jgi:hypothetical protein
MGFALRSFMAGPMVFDIILMLSAIDAIMAFTPFLKGRFFANPFSAFQLSTGVHDRLWGYRWYFAPLLTCYQVL